MPALPLYALDSSRDLAEAVARAIGCGLSDVEEVQFEDGESKAKPLVAPAGRVAYVFQSLDAEATAGIEQKLLRLLMLISALKDSFDISVTAVLPYLAYSRLDRKVARHDPVGTRLLALILEAAGVDRVLTLDVHNLSAYENAFRRQAWHLEAAPLFVETLSQRLSEESLAVISPDAGGIKRARRFQTLLSERLEKTIDFGFVDKSRGSEGVVAHHLYGAVSGKTAILFDDMISSGRTIERAAALCAQGGAVRVVAAATHGLFAGDCMERLRRAGLQELYVTDSTATVRRKPPFPGLEIRVVPIAGLLARSILSEGTW